MSIEMENPITILEKIDAASNLVQQMYLAHTIRDEVKFRDAHRQASELLADAIEMCDEKGIE
jgi:glycosylphosphatidylinositol transamidase (GPIT) subunit GPI8